MSTVYILTKGNYSDYHIIGVETDLERAENIQKLLTGDGYGEQVEIEEWEVGKFDVLNLYPKGMFLYLVLPNPPDWMDGGMIIGNTLVQKESPSMNVKTNEIIPWEEGRTYGVMVWARDYEHAARIGTDLIAQHRAEQET
jgi:hypothetical protein